MEREERRTLEVKMREGLYINNIRYVVGIILQKKKEVWRVLHASTPHLLVDGSLVPMKIAKLQSSSGLAQ
jgi:hypothetical protein